MNFRDGGDAYSPDDMYDDGYDDLQDGSINHEAFPRDDFNDIYSAKNLTQDSYYTEEYEEERSQPTQNETDGTHPIEDVQEGYKDDGNESSNHVDPEMSSPGCDGRDRSETEKLSATFDHRIVNSADNVDQDSVLNISSPESTTGLPMPINSPCSADASKGKSCTAVALDVVGSLTEAHDNHLDQFVAAPTLPKHLEIQHFPHHGSGDHVENTSDILATLSPKDNSSHRENGSESRHRPLANPSNPSAAENSIISRSVIRTNSPRVRPVGSLRGALAARGTNEVIKPISKDKADRNTQGLRRRFEASYEPQINNRNSSGIAGLSADKGLHQQQQFHSRDRQIPHGGVEYRPVLLGGSPSSRNPVKNYSAPQFSIAPTPCQEETHTQAAPASADVEKDEIEFPNDPPAIAHEKTGTAQVNMQASDIGRERDTNLSVRPTRSSTSDPEILSTSLTTAIHPPSVRQTATGSQVLNSMGRQEVSGSMVNDALESEHYGPRQLKSNQKRTLPSSKDQMQVSEEFINQRSSVDMAGVFQDDSNAVVGGRPPRGPPPSRPVLLREVRSDRTQNAPNSVSSSRGFRAGIVSPGTSGNNRDGVDIEAQIDTILAKTSKRLREIQQDTGGGGVRTDGNMADEREHTTTTQKAQRIIERDRNIPAFVAALDKDSYALVRALCRLMTKDALFLTPMLFQNDQDLAILRWRKKSRE